MTLHDAPCPKRTTLFSSMASISQLDLGTLTKKEKAKRIKLKTVRA